MQLGIPALMEISSVAELAALCSRLGFAFVELNTNFPDHQIYRLNSGMLNEIAQQYDIYYTIHLNDEMPVADFNPTVAQGYRRAVLEAIDIAKQIHAPVINMHLSQGAHYTMPDGIVHFYEKYPDSYLDGIRAFRDACTEAIGSQPLRICMENSVPYFDVQKQALDILLESPVFALTLDIGHSYCCNHVDEAWILQRRHRLKHMHIHDAKETKQDHLPLGTGQMDIAKYLNLAEQNGCTAVIEVKTVSGLEQSKKWLSEQK